MNSSRVAPIAVVLLSTTLFAGLSCTAHGQMPDVEAIDEAYAGPGQRIELADGRALNMRCAGEGTPVVMLEAGGNADSSTWYRVQPRLARLTRVCAYDRAGYGFSEEGPYPRDLEADAADLHALIRAADVPTPVVLVGHSRGSNIVRRIAQRHPEMVAGMVLVDPPEQGPDDAFPQDWQAQVASMLAQRDEVLNACGRAADAGEVDVLQQTCLRAPPSWMGESVAAAMRRNKAKPSYWRTLRSELAHNIALFSVPVAADESYGAIPLVLLAATGQEDTRVPDEVRAVIAAARRDTHARILTASTRSSLVEVPNASHDIQFDQPEAVLSAVKQLLGAAASADAPPTGN